MVRFCPASRTKIRKRVLKIGDFVPICSNISQTVQDKDTGAMAVLYPITDDKRFILHPNCETVHSEVYVGANVYESCANLIQDANRCTGWPKRHLIFHKV